MNTTPFWASFKVVNNRCYGHLPHNTFFASTLEIAQSFQSYWGGQIEAA